MGYNFDTGRDAAKIVAQLARLPLKWYIERMAPIHFKCPRCGAETELQMEAPTSLFLLSCRECRCPLMYFAGQAFEIDGAELDHLKSKQMKAVEGFMKIHRTTRQSAVASQQESSGRVQRAAHKAGEPVRAEAIASDDITDLIIDLETCEDVDEFLKRLG